MHAFDKLHEECGVFGIYLKDGKTGVVPAAYHALYALQHRGQESCGIAVNNDGVIDCYKDVGLVNEVFTRDVLEKLPIGALLDRLPFGGREDKKTDKEKDGGKSLPAS